jgi:1,4-dihydroxy-6-naphthoate synthase
VGRDYGPILIANRHSKPEDLAAKRIGVPGTYTTAYLFLRLYMPAPFQPVMLPFERIMEAVEKREVDAGVIIHEGQLTWAKLGFEKVLDLGEAWMKDTKLPIPLGLDVIHRRLGAERHERITKAMEALIRYAREHEDEAIDYALEFGRGILPALPEDPGTDFPLLDIVGLK